jgi:hypothetical protein
MPKRDLSYAAWQARRAGNAARCAAIDAGLPPYRRERLRAPSEAQFLRELGTPEELIGPVGTDEEVARERAELVEFARRLRAKAAAER